MPIDADTTLQDMIRAAYRLSWPGPAPRPPTAFARLKQRVAGLCRRHRLAGWPVQLSAPQG